MAERMVSAAVFTIENDQSFLQTGISQIGAAIIGTTTKGPAFVPTTIKSYDDYLIKFGISDQKSYVPYTVKTYMKNSGTMTIVKILGLDGYVHNNVCAIIASGSVFGKKVVGILHNTNANYSSGKYESTITGSAVTGSNFYLTLSGSGITKTVYSASLRNTDNNYIGKFLGESPITTNQAYFYTLFDNYAKSLITTDANAQISIVTNQNLSFSSMSYAPASTPWITSQKIGTSVYNLLRFKTRSDGTYANTDVKVAIRDIKRSAENPGSSYGSFTVVVRLVNDLDKSPSVVETYTGCTLDPTSPTYVAKVIGDRYPTYNTTSDKIIYTGDYTNMSEYIYVEVSSDVTNMALSPELVPYGFFSMYEPVNISGYTFPTASLKTTQTINSTYNINAYYGFDFDFDTTDNKNYLMPLPATATTGSNIMFNLDNYFVASDYSSTTYANMSLSSSTAPLDTRKFIVPFQGGFNGYSPSKTKNMGVNISATNTSGFDCSTITAEGARSYDRAFKLLSNQDLYDINLLLTPGLTYDYHPAVITRGIDLCESRGDCFYVTDPTKMDQTNLNSVVASVTDVDTSYSTVYYPWVRISDTDYNNDIWVPASVMVAGVYSYNDTYGEEWYAPAGLNRGTMTTVNQVYMSLAQADRDVLYDGRVNPIAVFPGQGVCVWGQKTLQAKPSALDRNNVRRLLIKLKKFVASTSRYLLFENNTVNTRASFVNMVTPYLETISQKNGLYAYKVVCDESNNTPDVIDRNILKGTIFLQPAKAIEFIELQFNITKSGTIFI